MIKGLLQTGLDATLDAAGSFIKENIENAGYRDRLGDSRIMGYNPSSQGEVMGWIAYEAYTHPVFSSQEPVHDASDIIHLHMPHQLESKVDVSYEDGTGAGALKGLGSDIVNAIGKLTEGDRSGLQTVANTAQKEAIARIPNAIASGVGKVMDNSGISKAVLGVDGEGMKKATQKLTGMVPNPHEEMFFSNVEMREFSFQHKLIAFDEKDTYQIDAIINTFKYYASPGLAPQNVNMVYPAQFKVRFYQDVDGRTAENPFLPKLGKCVLTSVEVNHAASDGWAVHHNGAPADIDLTLSFKEIVPRFKHHYKDRAMGRLGKVRGRADSNEPLDRL